MAKLIRFHGVLAPLEDPHEFARVQVNRDLGTVVGPCGADLEPDVLYANLAGTGSIKIEPQRSAG